MGISLSHARYEEIKQIVVDMFVTYGVSCVPVNGCTFAAGNPVPYSYQTVDTIEGVKVLVGINGKHGLPEEAHTSSAYISLHQNGNVKQLRLYNSNLTAKTDIEYSVHQGKLSLHAHDYVGGVRQSARPLTEHEKKAFMKFFGGT